MAGRETANLILTMEMGGDLASARRRLDALLAARDVSSVSTIIIAPSAGSALSPAVQPLVGAIQAKGIAALLHADARLARTLRADGVHLPASDAIAEDYADAREILGTRFIAGVDAGHSRHDAMALGEAGADYVGFGLAAGAAPADDSAARDDRLALVDWWSEIFEVPCIALDVATAAEARTLFEAGADFVAVAVPGELAPDAAASWLAEIAAALRVAA